MLLSSSRFSLYPEASRKANLQILLSTQVNRVLFEGKRAVGVKFTNLNSSSVGNVGFARARKEVILSAGVIGSPTLLMRSGIGPKSVLDLANVMEIN